MEIFILFFFIVTGKYFVKWKWTKHSESLYFKNVLQLHPYAPLLGEFGMDGLTKTI